MPEETVATSARDSIAAALTSHSVTGDEETETPTVEEERSTQTSDETKAGEQTPEAQDTEKAAGAPKETADTDTDEFLKDVDLSSLTKAERRKINKILTPKFQEISKSRKGWEAKAKEAEEILQHKPFIDALRANPKETVLSMLEELGMKAAEEPKPETKQEAKEVAAGLADELKAELPDDLHPLADVLAKVIEKRFESEITSRVDKRVGTIEQRVAAQEAEALKRQDAEVAQSMAREWDTFITTPEFKDAPKHEAKILALMNRIEPAPGTSPQDYLADIYRLATIEQVKAEGAREAMERVNKSARAAETDGAGVSGSKVSAGPSEPVDAREAIKMGLRGIMVAE